MKKRKSVRYYKSPDEKYLNELGSLKPSPFSPGNLLGTLAPAGCVIIPLLLAAAVSGGLLALPKEPQSILRIILVLSVGIKLFILPELASSFPDDFFGACNFFHNWAGYLGILSLYFKGSQYNIIDEPLIYYGIWLIISIVICFLFLKNHKVHLNGKRVLGCLFLCLFLTTVINAAVVDLNVNLDRSEPAVLEQTVVKKYDKNRYVAWFSSARRYYVETEHGVGRNLEEESLSSYLLPYKEYEKLGPEDKAEIYTYQGLFGISWCEVKAE
ncbi:hypothetical protein GPL15_21035 [Clostridium sp. MCC353]|uniref:hypothetical protein n=1 Tax=Clostridium sp. MCC353 TaxID=2592646 RepID=UPI001C02B6FF|nr:hypothetical protein [Clostridium sp. MCC353]MBT9778965.1 hypothetical protein [Clostridium sp. MCC353]